MKLEKQVVRSGVPETGGPFNLGVAFGPLLFISGLPPFREEYAAALREARTRIHAGRTPLDCDLEIEAIGYIPGRGREPVTEWEPL